MKKSVITLLSLLVLLVSCSKSSNDDEPKQTLVCRSASIGDGTTADPENVTNIIVSFNNLIKILNADAITLNNKKVPARTQGMDLIIDVDLAPYNDYTLTVGAGAVCMQADESVKNKAYTVKFNTNYGLNSSGLVKTPVNKNATAEAKTLYNYLYDNYGKKMISGAMGGVAWETGYTDFIKEQTGAYPMVVGFDYIHLPYSPANWINYGDLTPIKKVAAMGCIVQIGWHWSVPVTEGSTNLTFYKDGNYFNPANVLVEGSWENKVAIADVDKLAGYLKLLQDAKIPVLWRPLHEAAGDYGWGAWFWWGTQGTKVTADLYRWLYDTLTNKYQLNNLIWVWTMCTSDKGKPADLKLMQDAYPGDEYVDIVGVDLYPSQQLTDQTAQFNLVNAVVDSRKMVALTECGNLVSPESSYKSKGLWSYFMQWYDMTDGVPSFTNYKGPQQWKQVIDSEYVISIK